jgi:hypothetical protein
MATNVVFDVTVPRTFGHYHSVLRSLTFFWMPLKRQAIQKDEQPIRSEKNLCESAYIGQEHMNLIEFLSAVAANLKR